MSAIEDAEFRGLGPIDADAVLRSADRERRIDITAPGVRAQVFHHGVAYCSSLFMSRPPIMYGRWRRSCPPPT